MKLHDLENELRAHIRARIGRGELTVSGLARTAGFPQGHLSNFLNSRRGLSLESMDRLLGSLEVGLLDLVGDAEIERRGYAPISKGSFESVAMVSAENAALARFDPEQILEMRSFRKSFLRRLKPADAEDRRDWLRFVLIKLNVRKARRVVPLDSAGATLLIDRHYSSLEPYRPLQPNIYVVRLAGSHVVRYVSLAGDRLVLRPRDPRGAAEVVSIDHSRGYAEYIVGRVCHVGLEV